MESQRGMGRAPHGPPWCLRCQLSFGIELVPPGICRWSTDRWVRLWAKWGWRNFPLWERAVPEGSVCSNWWLEFLCVRCDCLKHVHSPKNLILCPWPAGDIARNFWSPTLPGGHTCKPLLTPIKKMSYYWGRKMTPVLGVFPSSPLPTFPLSFLSFYKFCMSSKRSEFTKMNIVAIMFILHVGSLSVGTRKAHTPIVSDLYIAKRWASRKNTQVKVFRREDFWTISY